MADTFEFSDPVTVDNVFQGERFVEHLSGTVTPKSERQAFACEVAIEAHPSIVKRKKGKG